MTQVLVLEARRDASGGYKVDVGRGERIGRVSSEWFSRPADERYLSLSELARAVRDRADRSRTRVVESALIHVEANRSEGAVRAADKRAQFVGLEAYTEAGGVIMHDLFQGERARRPRTAPRLFTHRPCPERTPASRLPSLHG